MASLSESTLFAIAMEEALRNRVYMILKKPLMELAEKEIDKACGEAVREMNISTEMYRDQNMLRDTVHFLLQKE